jgi:hypothetical protein
VKIIELWPELDPVMKACIIALALQVVIFCGIVSFAIYKALA